MAIDPARPLRLMLHLLILRPLLHLIFGLNVRGRENLPTGGPFVIAANHNSHLDILMLCAALPVRLLGRTGVVAARDYFARHRLLFAAVTFLFRPVWVDRNQGGGRVVEEMAERLDRGDGLILFPEGTRGEAGRIGGFHEGVGRLLVERSDVPLIPAYLMGSERALPRKSILPLPVWHHLSLGPPLRLTGDAGQITDALRSSILTLERSETASRHRRRPDRRRAVVTGVLGIDGSGKSTVSRKLTERFSSVFGTCLISDGLELFAEGRPHTAQPMLREKLRRWLGAQAKDAKSLARYRIPKLSEMLLRDALLGEARRWHGPDLIVLDGAPLMNLTAWATLYRPELMSADFCDRALGLLAGHRTGRDSLHKEFPELRLLSRLGLTRLNVPDLVIFLDVDPAVSMHRIEARGERQQAHETTEKLIRLREAYRLTMDAAGRLPNLTALVIDGDRDPDEVIDEAVEAVRAAMGKETT